MSQIIKNLASSGPLPPQIPTAFTTDYKADFSPNGTSVPVANILHVPGGYTAVNNDNGIATQSDPNGGPNLLVLLTNRVLGTQISTNGSTETLITVPLGAAPASYRFFVEIVGRDLGTNDCVGYTVFGSAKTDGITGALVETPYQDIDEDASLIASSVNFFVAGNNGILQVTGIPGHNIVYKAIGTYLVV